ncbi:MAG: hypothetical protein EPN39_00340 [Chitinophagaceae bacterium]|nr:MAG: hypothetical protein EPN39_00340 [Chitinophagaceae bacterium]
MKKDEMVFNENQFKRVGMLEAFTPEVKEQMEKGVLLIEKKYQKDFDEEHNTATLYLRKGGESSRYFLNKFDMEFNKEGQEVKKQTFYLTPPKPKELEDGVKQKVAPPVKYTLKMAANLMAGRPVFVSRVSAEGKEYTEWERINFKKQLPNGNFEIKRYNENYGFDLDKVLKGYSILELNTPQYEISLKESLYRGNLQLATFESKDDTTERFYVSPNITGSSLHVYDEHKNELSLEKLMEKGYIKPELAEKLKQERPKEKFSQQDKQEQGSLSKPVLKERAVRNIKPNRQATQQRRSDSKKEASENMSQKKTIARKKHKIH